MAPNLGAAMKAQQAQNKAIAEQQAAAARRQRREAAKRGAKAGAMLIGVTVQQLHRAPDAHLRGLVTNGEAAEYMLNTESYFWPLALLLLLAPLLWLLSGVVVLATSKAAEAHGYIDGGGVVFTALALGAAWFFVSKYLSSMLKGNLAFTVRKEVS